MASDEAYRPPVIDDGNPCTADAWNAALGQVTHTVLADGTPCNTYGNATSTCKAGVCVLQSCNASHVNLAGDGCLKPAPDTTEDVHQFAISDIGVLGKYVAWAPGTTYNVGKTVGDQRVANGNLYQATSSNPPGLSQCTSAPPGAPAPSGAGPVTDGSCVWTVALSLPPGVEVETVASRAKTVDFVWGGDLHTSVWNDNNSSMIVGHYMPMNALDSGFLARCNPGASNDCNAVHGYDCVMIPADVNGHAADTTYREAQYWAGEYVCLQVGNTNSCTDDSACGARGACVNSSCTMSATGMRIAELNYWLRVHADWILYRKDASGPTGPADYTHVAWWEPATLPIPLDFTNPAVQDEMLRRIRTWYGYGAPGQNNAYSALSLDVVYPTNFLGFYGVYRNGWLVSVFNGQKGYSSGSNCQNGTAATPPTPGYCDRQYNNAVLAWLNRLVSEMHKDGLRVHTNVGFFSTTPAGVSEWIPPGDANLVKLFQTVDGVLEESGFTDVGNLSTTGYAYDGDHGGWAPSPLPEWSSKSGTFANATFPGCYRSPGSSECSGYMGAVQSLNKPYYNKNELGAGVLEPDQIQWALASYLLAKDHSASIYVDETAGGGDPGTTFGYAQLDLAHVGHPCGDTQAVGTHGYYRLYRNGYVAANVAPLGGASETIPAPPSGPTYYAWNPDPTQLKYSSSNYSLTLPYQTGLVLLSSTPLCQ
jgi:hypothetical protein